MKMLIYYIMGLITGMLIVFILRTIQNIIYNNMKPKNKVFCDVKQPCYDNYKPLSQTYGNKCIHIYVYKNRQFCSRKKLFID
jgi:hypothetical protein